MFAPRVALVTGASGSIGRSVAERLFADGHAVVDAGDRDVASRRDMAEIFDQVERDFGGVDIVVDVGGHYVIAQLAAARVRVGGAIITVSRPDTMTAALARELRELDITVDAVVPGTTSDDTTELVSFLAGRRSPGAFAGSAPGRIVAGRSPLGVR